jgi:hypothetical protein
MRKINKSTNNKDKRLIWKIIDIEIIYFLLIFYIKYFQLYDADAVR